MGIDAALPKAPIHQLYTAVLVKPPAYPVNLSLPLAESF